MPLSLSPLQEHRSGHNRGWEASTVFTNEPVHMWDCVSVCVHAHVWTEVVLVFCGFSLLVLLILQNKMNCGDETGLFTAPKICVQGQVAADWPHFPALHLSVWSNLRYSLACVCLWVNKNHCLVRLRNIALPFLSTEDSVAPSSYRQTLCSLLIYAFVEYNNNNVFFSSGISSSGKQSNIIEKVSKSSLCTTTL